MPDGGDFLNSNLPQIESKIKLNQIEFEFTTNGLFDYLNSCLQTFRVLCILCSFYEGLNECATGQHNCSISMDCIDTDESYHCECSSGYSGGLLDCIDIDECGK